MALDKFRRIDMQINRANDYQIETQFAKDGDYNGRELVVQITNAGEVSDQNGVSLNLGWRHDSAGNTGLDPFTIVDASKGIFKITYPTEMLIAGDVTASIQVLESGKITLTRNFKITVEKNPIDDESVESENSFTALTEALVKVNDLEDNYAPRLNEVTAQLAQTAQYVNLKDFPRLTTETDDTGRIKRAVVSCREGDTLLAQKEDEPYYISDSISISKKINIRFENDIVYTGQKDRPAVIVKSLEFNEVYFLGIYDEGSYPLYGGGYHGWESDNYIGLLSINCKECDILVKKIYGFTVAHKSQASGGGGHWFNNIYIKRTLNNKIGIEMNSDGEGSWCNGNYFYELSNGFSGTAFNGDTSQKYTFLQTMTNGNKYGGNSNVFSGFKFEVSASAPENWTQIYLRKAISFIFSDYRYENNKQGVNQKFCVIDLSDTPTTENWQGARENILKPFSIIGHYHNIEFINNKNVNLHWSKIIKFEDSEKSEIFRRDNIVYDYRKLNANYHLIRGLYRRPIENKELLGDVPYEYFPGDVVDGNSVEVRGSFPIVAYIKNLKKGDEIEVLVNAKNGNSSTTFMPFSNGEPIPGGLLNDSKVISLFGSYSSANSYFSLSTRTIPKIFTVTEDGVDTVAVMLIGDIIGFSIQSNNRNNYVATSSSSDLTLLKDYISPTMPTLGDKGYWKYDEVVYNSNKLSGAPIGWQYKGNDVWVSIGNRT